MHDHGRIIHDLHQQRSNFSTRKERCIASTMITSLVCNMSSIISGCILLTLNNVNGNSCDVILFVLSVLTYHTLSP